MNYTTEIGVLKRAIHRSATKISAGMPRPFQKFTADMCYGAMAAKSCAPFITVWSRGCTSSCRKLIPASGATSRRFALTSGR